MPADPADYQPRFTSAEVCQAAGISAETLKNWVSRKPAAILLDKKDQAATARGVPIRFSFNRVMQIALTAELVRLGWQPRAAAMVAVTFSDVGETTGGWVDDPTPPDPNTERDPGQL